MTQNSKPGPQSMRYTIEEVLSGMLASTARLEFTDDTERLGVLFKALSQAYPMFAPFAAIGGEADFSAILRGALQKLVAKGWLQHEPGRYSLTEQGRSSCRGSKQTLFKASDREQLEAAACYFDAHESAQT